MEEDDGDDRWGRGAARWSASGAARLAERKGDALSARTRECELELTDEWAQGKEAAGCLLGQAGPVREGREEDAGWAGKEEEVGRCAGFASSPFLPLFFSFSGFQTSLKLLNSNMNLNSTLALKQIKQCTSMSAQTILNLEKNLITCGRKLN